jgi:hypothetical protein
MLVHVQKIDQCWHQHYATANTQQTYKYANSEPK